VRLIREGMPNKQIAVALGIAERRVKAHITSAMDELGVDNRRSSRARSAPAWMALNGRSTNPARQSAAPDTPRRPLLRISGRTASSCRHYAIIATIVVALLAAPVNPAFGQAAQAPSVTILDVKLVAGHILRAEMPKGPTSPTSPWTPGWTVLGPTAGCS
jgi:hypothetical protein